MHVLQRTILAILHKHIVLSIVSPEECHSSFSLLVPTIYHEYLIASMATVISIGYLRHFRYRIVRNGYLSHI